MAPTAAPDRSATQAPHAGGDLAVPLDRLAATDLPLAGGKGANLGELVRHGFRVPDGFVVTTAAHQCAETTWPTSPATLVDGADGSAAREAVVAADLPADVAEAVTRAYEALGGGSVAVRSSATAEDQPGAAFAGQQDTFLHVDGGSAVLDAVRRCWASLWTDRAIAYRRERGVVAAGLAMAVVVQRMVEPDQAGVLLTADPVTGDRHRLVVEAVTGLGEALVSGLVTPDRYAIDAGGRVLDRSPAEGGHRLDDAVLVELARLGTAVAEHFERPQDVEWALAGGVVWLVQARPMTALPPPPVRLTRPQRVVAATLLDLLPVRPYPMDMSTWVPRGPIGLMSAVAAHFGVRALADFLVEQDGVVERLSPPAPRPLPAVVLAPWRIATLARRHDPARWTADARYASFRAATRALADEDLRTMSWSRLAGTPSRALDLAQPIGDLRTDYLPRTGLATARLWAVLCLLGRRSTLGALLAGVRTRTTDTNDAVERLAAMVREQPGALAAVTAADRGALAQLPALESAFHEVLEEYGHRETTTPLLVSAPTWDHAPQTLLALVGVLAAGAPPPPREDTSLTRLLDHRLLRSPRAARAVRRWLDAARAGAAFREDSHFAWTRPLPVLRAALLEIGRRLTAAQILDDAEQVFHLRLEEVATLDDPATLPAAHRERLAALARSRAARRTELAGTPMIDPASVFPQPVGGDALVAGTPASAGRASGPVRVVRGPEGFSTLRDGEVLVCPYTNPSWTPLFARAAAVVVDAGGAASHAAIVAREHRLPAVMGTGSGTSLLVDGQVVTVDGSAGRVLGGDLTGGRRP